MNEKNYLKWIETIKNGNNLEKEKIIESIISANDKNTVTLLIPLLKSRDINSRMFAHVILSKIGYLNIEAIIALTHDEDPDQRTFACEILGNIKDKSVIPHLIKKLDDEDSNVKSAAAQALGNFKGKRVVSALIKTLIDDEWVAFSAINSLGKIKDKKTIPYLFNIFRGTNDMLSISAFEALLNFNKRDIIEAIIMSLKEWGEGKRNGYLEILYEKSKKGTFKIFKEMMGEEIFAFFHSKLKGTERKNIQLLKNISLFKRKEALDVVLSVLKEVDPDLDEYEEVIKILSNFKDIIRLHIDEYLGQEETILSPLIRVCAKQHIKIQEKELLKAFLSGSIELKREIISALPFIIKGNGESIVVEAIKNPDGHVRGNGFKVAGKMKIKSLKEEIIKSSKDDYFDVRVKAFSALIDIDRVSAFALIEHFLKNGSSMDKKVYLSCVEKFDKDINYPFLKKLCEDSDEEIRRKAIRVIGSLSEDERFLDLLKQNLKDEKNIYPDILGVIKEKRLSIFKDRLIQIYSDRERDIWTRYYALSALASFKKASLFDVFLEGLGEENKLLKIASIKALSALKEKRALNFLKPLLNEQDQEIKEIVSTVIKEFEVL